MYAQMQHAKVDNWGKSYFASHDQNPVLKSEEELMKQHVQFFLKIAPRQNVKK